MLFQKPPLQTPADPARTSARPGAAEIVQRWQEDAGIEGAALEWMLDRTRPPQEARP
ncbi:hypothetical protein [Roseovarius sp. Pro17]|uniref:hypothetical protein n=1 Tax=Roseovarius sp. Pro17 TaxID=3108175 RepID=UPI002D7672D8|nr:hypothetical protein [Roseovarius sp. Pro17]